MNSLPSHAWTVIDLLNHLWQSSVVAVCVLALLAACGGLAARTRRTLGWMALLKFFIPLAPLARWLASLGGAPHRWLESRPLTLPVTMLPAIFVTAGAGHRTLLSPVALLGALWCAGFVLLFGAWLRRGFILRRRALSGAHPIAIAFQGLVAAAAHRAGLKRVPRCLTAGSDHGPGVLGVVTPTIILPPGLERALNTPELETVLIHECVHLRRRDNLVSALQAFCVSTLWFNPLVWLLHRQISAETEKSCDECVLEITGDAETYAGSIVKSVQFTLGVASPGFAGATTPPVVARVKNILAHSRRRNRPYMRGAALVGGALLLALSGYAGSFAAPAPAPTSGAESGPQPVATAAASSDTATLSIDFPDEDIRNIIRNVADLFKLNVIMPPTLTGRTTVKLRDVTWRQIFHIVLEPAGYTFTEHDAIIQIVPIGKPLSASEPADFDGISAYDISQLDQIPVARSQKRPTYPADLRTKGITGEATIDFIVDDTGTVINARAIRSTHDEFAAAALEAVSQWRFKPGRFKGKVVNTHMQVPIVFTLNEKG